MSLPSGRWERDGFQIRDLHLRIFLSPPAGLSDWDGYMWLRNHAKTLETLTSGRVVYRYMTANMLDFRRVHNWAEFLKLVREP